MKFQKYWQNLDAEGKRKLAKSLKKSKDYLAQIACGAGQASHSLAKDIEKESKHEVTRHDLRPDIFGPPPKKAANE